MKQIVFGAAVGLLPMAAMADPSLECSLTTSSQVETADCRNKNANHNDIKTAGINKFSRIEKIETKLNLQKD